MEGGKNKIICLSLHWHHQNDSCTKMGSDESQFNISSIVRDTVTRQCPQTTAFEEKGEPKRIRTEAPCLLAESPFLIGRMFVREPSWKYSANLVDS